MADFKQQQEIIRHLVSFPELNPNPVLEIDFSGRIVYCNLATTRTLKEIGLAGKDIRDFLPKELKRILKSLKKNKKPLFYEVKIINRIFIGNICLAPETKTAHIYLTDITERKYAEEALRGERDLARKYLNTAGVITVVIDKNQKVRLLNKKGCEILGVAEKDAIGKNWFSTFVPEKNKKETLSLFLKLISGKLILAKYSENFVLAKKGEERLIAWQNNVLRDEKGKIIAALSSGEDITERKQIEKALIERERNYRNLVEFSPEAIAIHRDGRYIYVNPAGVKLLGAASSKEIVGKRTLSIIAPDYRDFVKERIKNLTATNEPTPFREVRLLRFDCGVVDVEAAGMMIDYFGKPAIQVIFRDITLRKQAERALRKAKDELEFRVAERTAELVEANMRTKARNAILKLLGTKSSRKEYLDYLIGYLKLWSGCRCVGIRVLDAEGRIPYESYTGFSHKFWESENWLSIKEDQCACVRIIKGKPEAQDLQVMTKAGSFYSNNTIKFLKSLSEKDKGRFRGVCHRSGFASMAVIPINYKDKIIGAIHLADGREGRAQLKTVELIEFLAPLIGESINKFNLEDRLEKEHAILDAFFRHTITPFVFLDREFNFIRVNEAYAKACRRNISDFPGHSHFEFYPNEENEGIFRQVVQTKTPFQAFAKELIFPGHPEWGVTYWDWTLVPILDTKGEVEFLAFSLIDVTERKLAEERLLLAQKELESARRLSDIGVLAATVAHELRNPLGVIRTAAYNIKRKAQNPRLESHFINIEKKILESDQIINNLLFYSRLKQPYYESVRIYDILNECIKSARIRFSEHNVPVIKKINSLRKYFIDADPLQMAELVNNILNNAYDACLSKNCMIEIVAVKDGKGNIEITVKDNGMGMDKEHLERAFEPFFSTKAKGTGLGLTVCNQIVNLHGGKICIDSEKGKGTTVTVTVPIKKMINGEKKLND